MNPYITRYIIWFQFFIAHSAWAVDHPDCWGWAFSNAGALENAEYLFIAIAPRFPSDPEW